MYLPQVDMSLFLVSTASCVHECIFILLTETQTTNATYTSSGANQTY